MSVNERVAVAEVLTDGRDFLANALQFWLASDERGEGLIHERDWEMVQALTQAADLLLASAEHILDIA